MGNNCERCKHKNNTKGVIFGWFFKLFIKDMLMTMKDDNIAILAKQDAILAAIATIGTPTVDLGTVPADVAAIKANTETLVAETKATV